jgi:hypothetical protein
MTQLAQAERAAGTARGLPLQRARYGVLSCTADLVEDAVMFPFRVVASIF